jgi:hypothetical protein
MYMGPAAERFVTRQIADNLGLDQAQLEAKHMEGLGEYCYASGKMLMSEGKARQFGEKIKLLGRYS